jgi:hypothetical protein
MSFFKRIGVYVFVKGFKELWEEELKKFQAKTPLPFKIKEVRMAKDPLGAVARGLLLNALSY